MIGRIQSIVALIAVAGAVAACSDVTSPAHSAQSGVAAFSGSVNTGGATGGGGGGGGTTTDTTTTTVASGGGAGGGGKTSAPCGSFSSIVARYVVVYTTRVGIGFDGTVTNCGPSNATFDVVVTDNNPDVACQVDVPHSILPHAIKSGQIAAFSETSTLIPCTGVMHYFTLTLLDGVSGTVLGTAQASAFR